MADAVDSPEAPAQATAPSTAEAPAPAPQPQPKPAGWRTVEAMRAVGAALSEKGRPVADRYRDAAAAVALAAPREAVRPGGPAVKIGDFAVDERVGAGVVKKAIGVHAIPLDVGSGAAGYCLVAFGDGAVQIVRILKFVEPGTVPEPGAEPAKGNDFAHVDGFEPAFPLG